MSITFESKAQTPNDVLIRVWQMEIRKVMGIKGMMCSPVPIRQSANPTVLHLEKMKSMN